MAGFVAVAAGAIMPGVATSISTIFSKVTSVLYISRVLTVEDDGLFHRHENRL